MSSTFRHRCCCCRYTISKRNPNVLTSQRMFIVLDAIYSVHSNLYVSDLTWQLGRDNLRRSDGCSWNSVELFMFDLTHNNNIAREGRIRIYWSNWLHEIFCSRKSEIYYMYDASSTAGHRKFTMCVISMKTWRNHYKSTPEEPGWVSKGLNRVSICTFYHINAFFLALISFTCMLQVTLYLRVCL